MTDTLVQAKISMDAKWHKLLKWGNGVLGALAGVNWGLAQEHLPDIQKFVPPQYYHLAMIAAVLGTFATLTLKGTPA